MKRFAFAIAIALFSLSSCTTSDAPTQATPGTDDALSKTTSDKSHVSSTIYNDCCGEEMTIEADLHTTISDETDKKGVRTLKFHMNTGQFVMTGSSSGIKYTASQIDKQKVVWQPGGCPATNTYTSRFRATATGSGQGKNDCSFTVKVTFKESLDADCNYTLEVLDNVTECE